MKAFAYLFCCFASLALSALVQVANSAEIYLTHEVRLDFSPESVFFFVDAPDSKRLGRIPGIALQPSKIDSEQWHVAAVYRPVSLPNQFYYSAIIIGTAGKYQFVSPQQWVAAEDSDSRASISELREELKVIQKEIKSWGEQYSAQRESLERLKSDASVIARLERVENIYDTVESTRQKISSLEGDIEHLNRFLKLARVAPAPKNFARRERDLQRQLAELADAAIEAESGESFRRRDSEQILQRHLRIVEATRSISPERLEQRLMDLTEQRKELEVRLGLRGSDIEQPDEYIP